MAGPRNWKPGSFTKNFSWGGPGAGLAQLYRAIEVGFDRSPSDVPREVFRQRLQQAALNDYVAANFFLFNRRNGQDFVVADELVRFTLSTGPGEGFNRLAAFALNLSLAGVWRGARPEQRYPAEWAKHFVVSRVSKSGRWDTAGMNAAAIRSFIEANPSYSGVWAAKVATNLNYIYELSGLRHFRSGLAESWWGAAIFLALDRIALDRGWVQPWPTTDAAVASLADEHVFDLTAVPVAEGMVAAKELVELYFDEGGPLRGQTSVATAAAASVSSAPIEILEKDVLPVERVYAIASRQVRDRKLVASIRRLYGDKCAACGLALPLEGPSKTYAEVGHVKPVGFPISGPDNASNVLPFCPNHHRQFDRGAIYFEVNGNSAFVVDQSSAPSLSGKIFAPASGHAFDMSNLQWHADFFLQR